jgi:hypothetical protein
MVDRGWSLLFFGKGENLTAWSAPFVFCFLFKPFQKSTNLYIYGRPIGRPIGRP